MEWEVRANLELIEQRRVLKAQEARLQADFLTEHLTKLTQPHVAVAGRSPQQST